MCDWLVVIERGALLYQGPASEFGGSATRVLLAPQHRDDVGRLSTLIAGRGYEVEPSIGGIAVLGLNGNAQAVAAEVNHAAAGEGITLVELRVERMSLEERYMAMVGASNGNGVER